MRWTAPLQRHRNVSIRGSNGLTASALLAFAERLLLAEAVEKLFWGLPNERLIRDLALKGKNDSLRTRIRFFHCAKAVGGRVLQQPQP